MPTMTPRSAREEGQTMAECAVVLTVICVATVAVFSALAGGIAGTLSNAVSLF